jgi:hypothetical protein
LLRKIVRKHLHGRRKLHKKNFPACTGLKTTSLIHLKELYILNANARLFTIFSFVILSFLSTQRVFLTCMSCDTIVTSQPGKQNFRTVSYVLSWVRSSVFKIQFSIFFFWMGTTSPLNMLSWLNERSYCMDYTRKVTYILIQYKNTC